MTNVTDAVEGLKIQLKDMKNVLDIHADEENGVLFVHTTDPRNWVDIPAVFPARAKNTKSFEVQMVVEQWGHWKSTVYEHPDYRFRPKTVTTQPSSSPVVTVK